MLRAGTNMRTCPFGSAEKHELGHANVKWIEKADHFPGQKGDFSRILINFSKLLLHQSDLLFTIVSIGFTTSVKNELKFHKLFLDHDIIFNF